MRHLTSLHLAWVKPSGIQAFAELGGEFETAFRFIRLVRVHPVVEAGPLRDFPSPHRMRERDQG